MEFQTFNPYPFFLAACHSTVQLTAGAIIKLSEIRGNFSTYQTANLLGNGIIKEFGYQNNTHYLPKLTPYLANAASLDFYGFFRIPSYYICIYTSDQVDAKSILSELKEVLSEEWELQKDNAQVSLFAKEQLKKFLQDMSERTVAFRTADQFKASLKNWLVEVLKSSPIENFADEKIDLKTLTIPLQKKSWLKVVTDTVNLSVDIVCVPAFMDEWRLIDLGAYAGRIGKNPLLTWVPGQSIDNLIWRGVALSNFLQFIDSLKTLWTEKLAFKQKKDKMLAAAVYAGEAFYSYSNTQKNWHPRFVNSLAIVAKSLGLIAALVAAPPTYLEDGS